MPKRKKIRRIISDKEVELEKWYKSYSENRSSWRKGFWLLIFSTILNIQTFFTHYYSDGISSPISKITFSGTIYCFFLTLYIRNNSLKLGPMKIGELYQKIEKNKLQVLIFGIPIITVVAFVLGFSWK